MMKSNLKIRKKIKALIPMTFANVTFIFNLHKFFEVLFKDKAISNSLKAENKIKSYLYVALFHVFTMSSFLTLNGRR